MSWASSSMYLTYSIQYPLFREGRVRNTRSMLRLLSISPGSDGIRPANTAANQRACTSATTARFPGESVKPMNPSVLYSGCKMWRYRERNSPSRLGLSRASRNGKCSDSYPVHSTMESHLATVEPSTNVTPPSASRCSISGFSMMRPSSMPRIQPSTSLMTENRISDRAFGTAGRPCFMKWRWIGSTLCLSICQFSLPERRYAPALVNCRASSGPSGPVTGTNSGPVRVLTTTRRAWDAISTAMSRAEFPKPTTHTVWFRNG
mmetsp:Transcript_22339/g.24855  ORF Transcript_22339/g.24855 Transcript_22339/m.24855 type:complete len:262 (+) Transcript_22339:184-969(+)